MTVVVETGVPLPKTVRSPDSYRPGFAGAMRQETAAIRDLAQAAIGSSVFIALNTYACEPEGIRTAAMRAGGCGWYAIRSVEGGWRIWKVSLPEARRP